MNVRVCLNGEDGVAPELGARGTTRTRLQRQFVHGRLGGGSVRPAMHVNNILVNILDKISALTHKRIILSVVFCGKNYLNQPNSPVRLYSRKT